MVVAIRMAWPYHKLRIKQKHQWKLARSWLLILLLLLFRIRPLVFNNDASNSASFLLKQERVNLLGPFHVQLSLRTRAISRYQQPTFSLLFDGKKFYKMQCKKKIKMQIMRWGEKIHPPLLWLWELPVFLFPACADQKVRTSRTGKCESVGGGREAVWRQVPCLVSLSHPLLHPSLQSSATSHAPG